MTEKMQLIGPMARAAGLYDRLINMAEARKFGKADTEALIAMMIASAMMQEDNQVGRRMVANRLIKQANEFVDMGLLIAEEPNEPPPKAG